MSQTLSPKAKSMASPSPLRNAGNSLLAGPSTKGITGNSPSSSSKPGALDQKDSTKLPLSSTSQTTATTMLSGGVGSSAPPSARSGSQGSKEVLNFLDDIYSRSAKNAAAITTLRKVSKGAAAEASTASNDSTNRPARPVPEVPAQDFSDAEVLKFHSAVRWGKPWPDIEAALTDPSHMKAACAAKDPKNGNLAIHIAAQNGHAGLVQKLIGSKADVNAQNGKGQTALHMTVEYDFYFVSKFLLANGADKELENGDGNKAISGIDGGKIGFEAWDNAVNILKAATNPEQLEQAFQALTKSQAIPDSVDKAQLIQAGMIKKKNPVTKDIWDHKRFMGLAVKF